MEIWSVLWFFCRFHENARFYSIFTLFLYIRLRVRIWHFSRKKKNITLLDIIEGRCTSPSPSQLAVIIILGINNKYIFFVEFFCSFCYLFSRFFVHYSILNNYSYHAKIKHNGNIFITGNTFMIVGSLDNLALFNDCQQVIRAIHKREVNNRLE